MKYLLPTKRKLRIWQSLARVNVFIVDGLIVVNQEDDSRILRMFEQRLAYSAANSHAHAAARFDAFRAVVAADRFERDKLIAPVVSAAARKALRAALSRNRLELSVGQVNALGVALDDIALRLGLFRRYRVSAI